MLLVILVCFGLTCAYIGCRNIRRETQPRSLCRPLSRHSLFWIINARHILDYARVVLLLLLVIVFVCWGGRISALEAVISGFSIAIIIGIVYIPVVYMQAEMWKSIRRFGDFDAQLQGKSLYYEEGNWWYADKDWLICAGPHSACAFYASDIDFSVEVYEETQSWNIIHGFAYIRCIAFQKKNGGRYRMQGSLNDKITAWFDGHREAPAPSLPLEGKVSAKLTDEVSYPPFPPQPNPEGRSASARGP